MRFLLLATLLGFLLPGPAFGRGGDSPPRIAFILPEEPGQAALVRACAEKEAEELGLTVSFLAASLPWGRQTAQVVDSIYREGASILVGAFESRTAHLIEQIVTRSKGGVLLILFAEDPTLTQINLPWVARITPSARTPLYRQVCRKADQDPAACSLTEALNRISATAFLQLTTGKSGTPASLDEGTSALEAFVSDALQYASILLQERDSAEPLSLLRDAFVMGKTGPLHFDDDGNRRFD